MTAVIIKVSVKLAQEKLWNITLKLELKEEPEVLLTKDFSQRYRTGQNVADIVAKFKEVMQKEIDDYKAEQQIYNNPQFDSAIQTLQGDLIV